MKKPKYFKYVDLDPERGEDCHIYQVEPVKSIKEADLVVVGKHLVAIDYLLKVSDHDLKTNTITTNYG